MIINCCSNDRVKLNNELEKIKIFFVNKEIETKKLEFLLNLETNDDFNLLKDEAIKGNKSLTNKLLGSTFFENDKAIYYLNTVNKSFMRLSEISEKTTSSSIEVAVNQIKPPVFWKDKPNLIIQSKKWNTIKIKKILKDIYLTEIKLKTYSVIKKDLIIKQLILDICNLANS
jgi:DNA polymerase-3 subunit delta